jgi:hypothetical protein
MTMAIDWRMGRRAWLLGVVLGLVAAPGCASLKAFQARQQYIQDQTRSHAYAKPIAVVWPEVRKLLFEQGFKTKDSDTGNSFSLETEEKKDGDSKVRYLVLGTKIDDGSCKVEFTRMGSGVLGPTSERDLDLEWALLRRVDPEAGTRIEHEATAAGEKTKT